MNIRNLALPGALILTLAAICLLPVFRTRAQQGEPSLAVPAIIEKGFSLWAKNRDPSWATDTWRVGGLLERDAKPASIARFFTRQEMNLGGFKNYESIRTQRLSGSSFVLYVAANFEKAVIYGRFVMYRTDHDWVVQNMDFSPRPENLMPWLAFDGETYTQ